MEVLGRRQGGDGIRAGRDVRLVVVEELLAGR
jgi:hypothetical protein